MKYLVALRRPGNVAAKTVALDDIERQNEGKRGDVADAMDRHHGLCLGVLGLSQALDLPVVLLDLERHLGDLGQDRTHCQLQPWRHRSMASLGEAPG